MIRPFELWGQRGWCNQEVVGESNYAKEIRAAIGTDFKPYGSDVEKDVYLIPEPTNRFDPNAVRAVYGVHTLGCLPKDQAKSYFPVLTALIDQGWTPQVRARIWGREEEDWEGRRRPQFVGSVTLDLTEPHMIVPANMPPADDVTIWVSEVWQSKEKHDASLQLPEAKAAISKAMPMLTGEFTGQEVTVVGGLGV